MISAPLIETSSRASFSKKVNWTCVKGSSPARRRLYRRRAPRATPRSSPAFSVMQTTILSASASLCVCSTTASVSTSPIAPLQSPLRARLRGGHARRPRSPGYPVEQPGQRKAHAHELREDAQGVAHAPVLALAPDYGEGERNEQCEQAHQSEVFQAFLPTPMSKASRASMKFRSPATIRKTLPYSEVGSCGCSVTTRPNIFEPMQSMPDPRSQKPKSVERSPSLVSLRP